MNQDNAIAVGSIADVAQRSGMSIAESFMAAEAVVIIDVSGSMSTTDSRGGKSRYGVALEELRKLQASLPGKIAVISFSDHAQFEPAGLPTFQGTNTDLAHALDFARVADIPDMRFFVVSDGEPDSEEAALASAKQYKARIDTIFVGPEREQHGRDFLRQLAQASGGQTATADRVIDLADKTEQLLLGDAEYHRKFARPLAARHGPNPMYR